MTTEPSDCVHCRDFTLRVFYFQVRPALTVARMLGFCGSAGMGSLGFLSSVSSTVLRAVLLTVLLSNKSYGRLSTSLFSP